MSNRKRLQVSRLKPAPPKLRTVMDLVNGLPPKIPHHNFALGTALASLRSWKILPGKVAKRILDEWRTMRAECSPYLQECLGPVRKDTLREVHDICRSLQEDRELLRAIARKSRDRSYRHPSVGSHFVVGEDGRLELVKGPTLQALEGVEANRIRICLVCEKIFWAGRKDKKCCGPRCLNVWHSRKWRGKYKEKYQYQRYLKAEQRSRRGP